MNDNDHLGLPVKIAVTGVNGFVGQHLARELVNSGHEVVGMGIGTIHPDLKNSVNEYIDVDLTERWPGVQCDGVVHLAALSSVGPSFGLPQQYLIRNSAPLTHMAESLIAAGRRPRILVVSTGAVYEPSSSELSEISPVLPTSPYAVSKLVAEAQAAYYRHRGLDVVVMRPFNHIGLGQGRGFLLPDLLAGAQLWRDERKPLEVGDLRTLRDYTNVKDVVRAYRLILEVDQVGVPVVNVCSGELTSGKLILQYISEALSLATVEVVVEPSRVRPSDPPEMRGSNSLLRSIVGWSPRVSVRATVREVVEAESRVRQLRVDEGEARYR